MQAFDLVDDHFRMAVDPFVGESLLPNNSILLQRTPFTYRFVDWEVFYAACRELKQQFAVPEWVFIDACWDPFCLTAEQIAQHRQTLQDIFTESRICVLSARADHYYDNLLGVLYFPLFLMINYPDLNFRPRAGRIGCLNRRNAAHRVWLMHHLLKDNLIDAARDVYSVRFTSLFSNDYWDLDGTLHIRWFNEAQRKWPQQIQTHPDNFPNDYSIDHPAWHTGISIITETEPGEYTLVCEKTAKGILSKSCFSVYMAESGYRVLEDLGFRPRFFANHAEYFKIDPLIKICQDIATESQAMEYRNMHMEQINHNYDWFGFRQGQFNTRPWYPCYHPKLEQALGQL